MIWIITSPETVPGEAAVLNDLAAAGPVTLLVRKPGWAMREYAALLGQLHDHSRVVVCDHPELLTYFPVAGLHVSEKMRGDLAGMWAHDAAAATSTAPRTTGITGGSTRSTLLFSTSIHAPVSPGPEWRYLLLGPVFDSISKTGYAGKGHLFGAVPHNALAVGGMQAGNIAQVKKMGFCGAALLGSIWQHPANAVKNYQTIQELWERS